MPTKKKTAAEKAAAKKARQSKRVKAQGKRYIKTADRLGKKQRGVKGTSTKANTRKAALAESETNFRTAGKKQVATGKKTVTKSGGKTVKAKRSTLRQTPKEYKKEVARKMSKAQMRVPVQYRTAEDLRKKKK